MLLYFRYLTFFYFILITNVIAYDPTDEKIPSVIPQPGTFEAFYPREMYNIPNSAARPSHSHGSFYNHRHPALIDVKNAAAYGKTIQIYNLSYALILFLNNTFYLSRFSIRWKAAIQF